MTAKLLFNALVKVISGVVIMSLLLFLPAGTFCFPGALLLMGVLFVPMIAAGFVLMFKAPELLKKRLNARENQKEQRTVVFLSALMFAVGFVIAGLNFRFDIFVLPFEISVAASVVFLAGYLLYAEVIRENKYLSRTIEVQEKQTVVDTGLYGIVRHPMYSATLLMFLSMPVILGDVFSFILFLSYPFIIAKRIKGEEALLEKELKGYTEYKKKVKYKMIPFIW